MENKGDALRKLEEWQQDMLNKYGWYVHYEFGSEDHPGGINYHTHGLAQKYGHPDLQICLALSPKIADGIIKNIVAKIKEGMVFDQDLPYTGLLEGNYAIRFIEAHEAGRRVLRVLVPDENGALEQFPYSQQLTMLKDRHPLFLPTYRPQDIDSEDDVIRVIMAFKNEYDLVITADTLVGNVVDPKTGNPAFSPERAQVLQQVLERCIEKMGSPGEFNRTCAEICQIIDELRKAPPSKKPKPSHRPRRGK